jgi:hypothetical protein
MHDLEKAWIREADWQDMHTATLVALNPTCDLEKIKSVAPAAV